MKFLKTEKEWLDSLDYSDRELVLMRVKLDTRTLLLRLSVALNTSLIAGFVIDLLMRTKK